MSAMKVLRAGPAMSIQDLGRSGFMARGLSHGGAADRAGLAEGAALLGQGLELAAIEMAGMGGQFEVSEPTRIALTGAPMRAMLDDQPLVWNASHQMEPGQILSIGAAKKGIYGYLHVGGGFATELFLNSRATHIVAGIGGLIQSDDSLELSPDPRPDHVGLKLPPADRFDGGLVRILPSVQTAHFSQETRDRFQATAFSRTPRGNRQGAELTFEGAPFASQDQLGILSEPMVAGDIQMTGEGFPFVLLPECQTTGGYPRIGTVLPDDLPRVAQATPGVELKFQFISHEDALLAHRSWAQQVAEYAAHTQALIRDPHEIADLLSHQLISGMVDARR
ncbi:MAG: biotin-dependent carboxyltransferase family protein [Pseudomonadota bacterium]